MNRHPGRPAGGNGGLARDRDLMGEFAAGRGATLLYSVTTLAVALCVLTLGVTELLS